MLAATSTTSTANSSFTFEHPSNSLEFNAENFLASSDDEERQELRRKLMPQEPFESGESFNDIFKEAMAVAGKNYSWKNIEVRTDDGYALQLFAITGKEDGT